MLVLIFCECVLAVGGLCYSAPLLVYMLHTTRPPGFINIDCYKGWIDA